MNTKTKRKREAGKKERNPKKKEGGRKHRERKAKLSEQEV
jgi:hypothetical protein